ncbi:DUF1015 family protein [Actinoallomurus soli]|uniref:DUF1015 family protein n=1 Tax=Actinoallomurus soli TaxID=2952535 RepID=UPI0020931FC5|nr:DUF1015 domain-containing protein [Actinoallomurus soli]MCO5973637.1 DUF1015 domain-containing protein [Actinoallomurus soli]
MPDVTIDPGLALRPFRAVRYDTARVDSLAAVTSPPYDLIDEESLARFMAEEPHNVVRLILPQDDYRKAAETLRSWLTSGILTVDDEPALYVYEEVSGSVVQRGLIGAVGVHEDGSGVILPHEHVYPGPVRDRLALMTATEANLEPIFLLYEGGAGSAAARIVDEVASSLAPVLETSTGDDVRHRLWAIRDPAEQAKIAEDLRGRQALIADGHHRYATYQALRRRHDGPGPWDYGLALLVDSVEYPPRLGAIHRVLPALPLSEAVRLAKSAFRVEPVGFDLAAGLERLGAHDDTAFLLGGDGEFVLLTDPDPAQVERSMPEESSDRWRRLDTAVLHRLLIPRVWGVEDDESNVRIVHHDAARAVAKARRGNGTAVILNPLKVPDVLAVAANGEKVPRKSTSFGPKPRTGLVMRTFAAD